jgi:Uma2 family endonuclease
MSLQPKPYYSFEDYLAAERESTDAKHEYVAGEVFAMTGASFNHNLITANLAGELRQQLKSRPCTVLSNDMRLRIQAADACAYPDIVVLCDKPAFYDGRKDVLTDATLLAEVFSPSTEGYDRGGKFAIYRNLPSLRQYLLIAQDRCAIDVFTCRPDGRWLLDAYTDPEAAIPCESIGCTLILRDVYDKVEFEPAPTPTGARPAL